MANTKTSCIRKGVVAGRVANALNHLYIQIDVVDEPDLHATENALVELKQSLGSLKRNFKGAAPEVQQFTESAKKLMKGLRKQPDPETRQALKKELRQMRDNFRKAVKSGYSQCGGKQDPHELAQVTGDYAFYQDMKADAVQQP